MDVFLYLSEQPFKALNYVRTTLHHVYSWTAVEVDTV